MLTGGYKVYLNKQEADFLTENIETNKKVIKIGEKVFFADSVRFILPASEIEREDKIKKGEWQCENCKRWHPKNEECGCQGGKF